MRSSLQTIRLRTEERRVVRKFLVQNSWISSFSELARLAVLDFIQRRAEIAVHPVHVRSERAPRPGFLWDYDLDPAEVKALLATRSQAKKAWLIGRILDHAPFREVWEYLTPGEIREALPRLRMNPKRKRHWEFALREWTSE